MKEVLNLITLALDPAGNHSEKEGNGTTGYAIFENGNLKDFGHVAAEKYDSQERYFAEVASLLDYTRLHRIICESYKLFGHKAKQQSGSSLDTPQLIGYLRMCAWHLEISFIFQDPKDKVRVTDPILVHMGILEQSAGGRYKALGRQTIIHERDAIRHGVFYHRYKKSTN